MENEIHIIAGGERYVTLPQAMQMFGVSRRTLYNWMDAGKVVWAYSPGGSRYIALSSLSLRTESGERLQVELPSHVPGAYEFLSVR